MKIDRKDFEALLDENISKKRYDEIIESIDQRFWEIMIKLCSKLEWADYANGYRNRNGEFCPQEYREEIEVMGAFIMPEPYSSSMSFPTRWLWEDTFKQEFDKEVKAYKDSEKVKKAQAKLKAQARKAEVEKLKASIKTKLTKEELRIVKFK